MHTRTRARLIAILALSALALAPLWLPGAEARAEQPIREREVRPVDKVVLTDGTEIVGEIIREVEGSVFIRVAEGINRERFIAADQIARIERGIAPDRPEAEAETAPAPGTPRGAVLTLEGLVGIEMTAAKIRELIPLLEEEIGSDGTGILVLKINSGGGMLAEVMPLSDTLHNELKERFQTVAWIESAISAAAMTAHTLEDIYFLPEGNYGAATAYSGQLDAVKDFEYQRVVAMAETLSARGGHDPDIMRAMQGDPGGDTPLSVRRDPSTGLVEWTLDTSGEDGGENAELLNPPGEVFTFNSLQAERWDFSRGTVATLQELTREMGYSEIDWVGERVRGLIHPVCKAERENREWRDAQGEQGSRFNQALTRYSLYLDAIGGGGGPGQDAARILAGRARKHLREIRRLYMENPNLGFNIVGSRDRDDFNEWYRQQDDRIRQLLR